ncbi:hypothetical protein D1006_20015 [Burkholderia stabilis]|uniref:Uncharacterized protein n=1 Tax=Burkholderia stabilis TaxID=95485 RepID=A0A4Q2AFS3_9BURK|nr:hypothetical protein D1006_20015 [Burkholderia stabilis]
MAMRFIAALAQTGNRKPPSLMRPASEYRRLPDIARQSWMNPRDGIRRSRNGKRPRGAISFRCVSVVAAACDALRQYRPQSFGHEGNT